MIDLVYVGRISSEKGVYSLVDKLLSPVGYSIDVKLHVFGEAAKGHNLEIPDSASDLVICYGWMDNPWKVIASLDRPISINFSRFESMGFSIFESMQHAIPIVATPTQGAVSFLAEIPGLLFSSLDPPLNEISFLLHGILRNYEAYSVRVKNLSHKYITVDEASLSLWVNLLSQ